MYPLSTDELVNVCFLFFSSELITVKYILNLVKNKTWRLKKCFGEILKMLILNVIGKINKNSDSGLL